MDEPAGQERFRSVTPRFYRNVHAVILVYSINSEYTFEALPPLIKEALDHTTQTATWALFGNKCDLDNEIGNMEEREKTLSDIVRDSGYAYDGIKIHCAVSAKTGENVTTALDAVVREVCRFESTKVIDKQQSSTEVNVTLEVPKRERSHCSC